MLPREVAAILWEFSEGGSELCVLDKAGRGWRLGGTALLTAEQGPVEIRYSVLVNRAWVTQDVEVVISFPNGDVRSPVQLGALWSEKERPPEFRDCVDVDLGFTPATNRTLGAAVRAACQGPCRYSSGSFSADLTVDEHGLVVDYEGLWRAIARA
jgi:hypothetical protein